MNPAYLTTIAVGIDTVGTLKVQSLSVPLFSGRDELRLIDDLAIPPIMPPSPRNGGVCRRRLWARCATGLRTVRCWAYCGNRNHLICASRSIASDARCYAGERPADRRIVRLNRASSRQGRETVPDAISGRHHRTEVIRPLITETTAQAAYLAGLAVGFWSDRNEIRNWSADAEFIPFWTSKREEYYGGWKRTRPFVGTGMTC